MAVHPAAKSIRTKAASEVRQPVAVGPASVQWTGNGSATRIHRTAHTTQPLASGSKIRFQASELRAPGNMAFKLQVYAPGVTDTWWDKAAAIRALDLHVESPLIRGGRIPVMYVEQGGIENHDFIVQARLSEMMEREIMVGPLPSTGQYPIRFMAGPKELAQLTLDWVK